MRSSVGKKIMATCTELQSRLSQINIRLNALQGQISQINLNPQTEGQYIGQDLSAKRTESLLLDLGVRKLYDEAAAAGCALDQGPLQLAINLENQIVEKRSDLYNNWEKIQKQQAATQQATTSTNNAGNGTPGSAGTGATPAAKPSPTTIPNTSDPTYKESPRGADDFGEIAPGLENTGPQLIKNDPTFIEPGTVEVDAPNFNLEDENTNTGLQGDIADAQAQATVQDAQNYAVAGDWRVRLALAPASPSILYRASDAGILAPLKETDGVIFPYVPSININYSASYEPISITHTNYRTFQYQNSGIDNITISCDFTAQDTAEANYLLAVIHFFRAATKMFYGQTQNPKLGTPPPLCYLYGLGQFQFNAHPLVISSFSYSLPNDVDYIRATNSSGSSPGVNRSPSNTRDNSPDISTSRLNGGGQNISPGGTKPPADLPTTAAGGTEEPTYIPTRIQLQISAYPVVTRFDQSKVFSNQKYNTGDLLKGIQNKSGGFW